uniref:Putative secreted protein n=1 Tax=Aedes albopictus TaxID=7160 RepID=A0A023EDA2_AEDAL
MGTIQRAASGVDLREHHIRFTNTKKKKHDLPLITTSNITKNEMTYSKNTQNKTMYKQSNTHAVLDGTLVTKWPSPGT